MFHGPDGAAKAAALDAYLHEQVARAPGLAAYPQDLGIRRADRSRIMLAAEEFFRVFMPLTHIGRVCPAGADVQGVRVPPGGRMSLGWAAANLDPAAFEEPCEPRLDRRPNPHVSFGFGPHRCLGAAHSRTLVRELPAAVCDRVERIDLIDAVPRVEATASYERTLGYERLVCRFTGTSS